MKIARSKTELAAGIFILAALACAIMISIDERMSRQLDAVDITWDELDPKPAIGKINGFQQTASEKRTGQAAPVRTP